VLSSKMIDVQRLRVVIRGVVQGVGFRPFVYKLAHSLGLKGWVINSSQGVFIEVEGEKELLNSFLVRVEKDKPIHAYIQSLESSFLDVVGFESFEIRKSEDKGEKTALILPDIATCPECLKEVFDPNNRRYLYPFTNCTLCGPRYTIIKSLPYDRPNTSMHQFPMCPDCLKEYEDPNDRRFHAQPNACPVCGPHIFTCKSDGTIITKHQEAIQTVSDSLLQGKIVAVKGIGGFHLMVDAGNSNAVFELRTRKRRNEKPFAIMMSSLEAIKAECEVDALEERLLQSSESPVVLLNRRTGIDSSGLVEEIAPRNPTVGIMLPYTPLHHILMKTVKIPMVATSGNLSDEPICIDNEEALKRLGTIADVFLLHNRPIIRHVDDSLVRMMAGREMVIRRARGYAPLPITVPKKRKAALAVGAHQKNTIAFQIGNNVILSQHVGDLETEQAYDAFEKSIDSLKMLYEVKPEWVVCDHHPGYLSTKYAQECGLPLKEIQHHHAHIAACMAENQLSGEVLGISWDGTGAGWDDTIWGGEFLVGNEMKMERFTWLRCFRLPGSSQAVKEPRRSALGVLYEVFGADLFEMTDLLPVAAFDTGELKLIKQMMTKEFNSPLTSSAGRLFDAVSSIIGIRQVASFEGQGAMELEFEIGKNRCNDYYSFTQSDQIDWSPMIKEIVEDWSRGIARAVISQKFHNTLVEMIVAVAMTLKIERVLLSGGCFQNRYLTEHAIFRLKEEGFKPYWHQRVPPNDGNIALGQLYACGDT